MRTSRNLARKEQAFTLAEVLIASAVGTVILGGLMAGSVAIQGNISATSRYATSLNHQSRLMDYLTRDLRCALRVSLRASGTETPLKSFAAFSITDSNVLVINVPDYYASNTPDNSARSPFKTTRYPRSTLNSDARFNGSVIPSLNGCISWTEALAPTSKPSARFAPASAGSGELQVRYFRAPRSAADRTACYFRGQYPANSEVPTVLAEIAEGGIAPGSIANVLVGGDANGTLFRLQTNFVSRFKASPQSVTQGTDQFVEVTLRNLRRD